MLVLREPADVAQVEDAYVRALLTRRFKEIFQEGYTYDELCLFVVAEPGDTASDIERDGGIWITTGPFNGARYGEPAFAPCFELLEQHPGHCFEMVHILNDSGYGVVVIVPENDRIDAELIRFSRQYATPTPEPIAD